MSKDDCPFSEETIYKAEIVKQIAAIQFKMVESFYYNRDKPWHRKYFPFVCLDLTAGQGLYPGGVEGIALALNGQLASFDFPKKTFLIDRSEKNCQLLKEIPFIGNVHIRLGDHHEVAPQIIETECAHNPYGLVCFDPNGFGDSEARLLTKIGESPRLARMDWLLHISGTTIKRVNECRKTIFKGDFLDVLKLTGKDRWLIKQSPVGKRQQWTYLFGTTSKNPMSEWKAQGWHDWNSKEGREILYRLKYTNEQQEILSQPFLFKRSDDESEDES